MMGEGGRYQHLGGERMEKDGKARITKAFCNTRTVVGGLVVGSGGVCILPAIPG